MKLIQSTIKILTLITSLFILYDCNGGIEGTFYISDDAKKYEIDTTITSITFIDNYGISESFSLDNKNWFSIHHYFSEWGTDGDAFGETYGLFYTSTVNRFFFMYVLRADVDYTTLEIEWNQKIRTVINFNTKQVESGEYASISFSDSLIVNGIKYQNIIELDYSDNLDAINDITPVKTYISGNKGLIKFSLKNGVTFERIE